MKELESRGESETERQERKKSEENTKNRLHYECQLDSVYYGMTCPFCTLK